MVSAKASSYPQRWGVEEGVANYFDSQRRDLAGVPGEMLVF
jgi:hypothetical protein